MATLEQKITEAHSRQLQQYLSESQKMVRITLLEPYEDWRDGSSVVTMRYGSEEARVMGQSRDGKDDEVIDLTQRPRKIIPGRPIHYHLSFEEVLGMRCECQDEPFDINNTIVMPLPGAMVWFGPWTKFSKIYSPGERVLTEDTVQHQRKVVALAWGGYKIRRFNRQWGDIDHGWKSLDKIGAPAVPKVELVRLDLQMRKIPNSEFRPWDVYEFNKEVVADRWSEKPGERILSFTEDQLREFIAAEVAKGAPLPRKAAGA